MTGPRANTKDSLAPGTAGTQGTARRRTVKVQPRSGRLAKAGEKTIADRLEELDRQYDETLAAYRALPALVRFAIFFHYRIIKREPWPL